ncbi:MAG: hypothetical protein U9P88_02335 [Patescibacteria group bacterium]|nr:hypothetical protein [Patescibacteria group bacterium]
MKTKKFWLKTLWFFLGNSMFHRDLKIMILKFNKEEEKQRKTK